jgi:cobalt/nickel transport system ATP-binding protein
MLDIENLNVIYPDGTQAVRDLTLHIGEGESVAIVGANGAGKSTLMLSVVGICTPSSGSIRVEGMESKKENLRTVREKAGIVFQNPDDQLFMPSIYDDVAFGPRNYGVPEEDVRARVLDVLESLHAAHLKDKMPHKLSGGEKRVAALASVLVMRPSIMLLDEPSSFLDPKARRNLIHLLKGLSLTQVIATHDLDMALDLCARVVVLKEGAIFADGDAQTILGDQKLMDEAGLELPLCWLGGKRP